MLQLAVPKSGVTIVAQRYSVAHLPAQALVRPEWMDVVRLQLPRRVAYPAMPFVPRHHRLAPLRAVGVHPLVLAARPQIMVVLGIVAVPAGRGAEVLLPPVLLDLRLVFVEPPPAGLAINHRRRLFASWAARARTRSAAILGLPAIHMHFVNDETLPALLAGAVNVIVRAQLLGNVALATF